ncbi:MAG: DUF4494 domain-containing protein [Paludibacteraceae bacterium]|nr:DUF4494 domain-containing protein [Paludibacteraceae bacterium]
MLLYEIKISYERQTGEDNPKNVHEIYLIEGVNCTDVESRLMLEVGPYISGDSQVTNCKTVQYMDIIDKVDGDNWYKGRVELITVDDSGKESRKAVSILVQAHDMKQALKRLDEHVSNLDCEIISLTKTKIMDVLHAVN